MKAIMIGNGFIGSAHRNAYSILKEEGSDVELVAICDIRPEKLEENNGAKTYTDVDTMLANEKDADYVDICLPTYLHAEYTVKCLEAGFNVMCEKPMALNREEADRMLDAAKRTGKKLMIGHCCRFAQDMQILRKHIMNQTLGKPLSAFFTSTGACPDWGFEDWFLSDERSGGSMLDLQAHNVDLINWYFGLPKSVSCVGKKYREGGGFDSISSNLLYDDGFFVHSWCDWNVPGNKHLFRSMRVNFENGYIFNERGVRHELVMVDTKGNVTDISNDIELPSKVTIRNEIEYFTNAIKTNQPVRMCLPEDSKKTVLVFKAQHESAMNDGKVVYLSEEDC